MLKILYFPLTTASCKFGKGNIAHPSVHFPQQWRYYSISLRMNWESRTTVSTPLVIAPIVLPTCLSPLIWKPQIPYIERILLKGNCHYAFCTAYLFSGFTLWFFSFKFRSNLSIPLYLSNTYSRMTEVTLDHQYPT